jgi:opacity protein-like surface antigen
MGKVMKKLIGSLGGAALLAFGAATFANAADMRMPVKAPPPVPVCGYSDITAANNQISVDFATTNVDYVEFNPPNAPFRDPLLAVGAPLDTENGWVPGVSVTGTAMFNLGQLCNVYVQGRFSYFNGHTDYWQPLGRLPGVSGAKIWEEDFRLGKGFDLAPNVMLTPYLGAGLRRWDRDLCVAGACVGNGFHEDYKHGYWGAGLMLQVSPISRLVLSASGLVGRTVGSEINGGPNGGNPTIVPFHAALGNSTIYKVEGSADYAITQNIHANVGVEWTRFTYGLSAPFVVDRFGNPAVEPDSRTNTVTVRAGLGFAFGAPPLVAKY